MALINTAGFGVGLQGIPDVYAGVAQENLRYKRAKEDEADKLRKAAVAKQDEDARDLMNKIEVKGVDPIYTQQIQAKTALLIDKMNKKKAANTYGNWINDPEIQKDYNDLKFFISDRQQATQKINQEFQALDNFKPEEIEVNQRLLDVYKSGDYDAFKKELSGSYGKDTDIFAGGFFKRKAEPFDPLKPINSLNPFETAYSKTTETPEGRKVVSGSSADKAKTTELVDQYLITNPDYVQRGIQAGAWKDVTGAKDFVLRNVMSKAKVSNTVVDEVKASDEYDRTYKKTANGIANANYSFEKNTYSDPKGGTLNLNIPAFPGLFSGGNANINIDKPGQKYDENGNSIPITEIRIANLKTVDENKLINVNDPDDPSKSIKVVPIMFRNSDKDKNDITKYKLVASYPKKERVGADGNGNPKYETNWVTIEVPEKYVKDDIAAKFDQFTLEDFLEGEIGNQSQSRGIERKKTTSDNQSEGSVTKKKSTHKPSDKAGVL